MTLNVGLAGAGAFGIKHLDGVAVLVRAGWRALLPGPDPPGWSRFHA